MVAGMEKKLWHEEDDHRRKQVDADAEFYEDVIQKQFKGFYSGNNGIPAQGPLAAGGRKCPRCSGQLYMKEETENEVFVVSCKDCGGEWHHTDLEDLGVTDQIYRQVSNESIHRYTMNRIDRSRPTE